MGIGVSIFLLAVGAILAFAVTASVAGISIQTIGMILFIVGAIWLVVELIQSRTLGRDPVARERVVEEPVYRDRRI